jgi:hypothetical protein
MPTGGLGGYQPKKEHLDHVMDIVENLLQAVYILEEAADEHKKSTPARKYKACLSGWLPKRWSDVKFPAWTPVVFRRRSPNFSEYSPMMRPAQDTLSTCGGRTGLRA